MIAPLLLLALALPPARPDSTCIPAPGDSTIARFARTVAAARGHLAADAGQLWGHRLAGEWLGFRRVGNVTCGYATTDPGAAGFVRLEGEGIWAGRLPPTINPANNDVTWHGTRWAGVMLPAGDVTLLLHELVHTLQREGADTAGAFLPYPHAQEGGAGSDQLEGAEGRTLLRLEMRALLAALRSSGDARMGAARDALAFRRARYAQASAQERQRQRALDVTEGLANYTAFRLAHADFAAHLAAAERAMDDTTSLTSAVRAFPYLTGPAYALLLDTFMPSWKPAVIAAGGDADLQALLERAIGRGDSGAPRGDYGRSELAARERARWERIEAPRRALRAAFTEGPTLRIRPRELRITFDPNGQVSLGADGSVMRNLAWKGEGGAELRAPEGALVTADWQELRVPITQPLPLRDGVLREAVVLGGRGWSVSLPAGWTAARDGASWVLRAP